MKRLGLLLPLLALAAAPARAEDPATNAAVVWVSRIPLDGSRPRYESASGLPGRYRLGTLDDGGTYSGVARLFFGRASAWPAIHEANRDRFPDPDHVPAEADLAVPAPVAALPPAAPGLAASISLASVERRPREGIAEDADPDFREKTHLRFRLSLTNETDRTIAVSFYKEFKSSFPGEPSAWFSGFCTFDDPETGHDALDEFQTEEWIYRIEPRSAQETWLDVGCTPSGAGPEMVLRVGCLLDDAEQPTSDPRDSPRILYWRGPVPVAAPRAEDPATNAPVAPTRVEDPATNAPTPSPDTRPENIRSNMEDERVAIWKPGRDGGEFLKVCTNETASTAARVEAVFQFLSCTDWSGRTLSDFGSALRSSMPGSDDFDVNRFMAVDHQIPVQWNLDEFLYVAWAPKSTEEHPVPDYWFAAWFTVKSEHSISDVIDAFRSGTNSVIKIEDLGFQDSKRRFRFSAKTGAIVESDPSILEEF